MARNTALLSGFHASCRALACSAVCVLAMAGSTANAGTPDIGFALDDVTNTCGVLPLPAPFGMTIGLNAVDLDSDGHIDLIASTDAGQRLQVYRNLGDGNFEEVAQQLALDSTRRVRATLAFDYDGDGMLDLLTGSDCWGGGGCPTHDALRLYRQRADSTFEDVTEAAGLDGITYHNAGTHAGGFAAGDLTSNGFLDLVIPYWNGKLRVFENNGDGSFTDISVSAGFTTPTETSFFWQAVLADFNDDGLLDMFLAVDFQANRLYLNNGDGSFTNHATAAGVNTTWNEMGVTVGDYDNDGRLDIYVTNIFNVVQGTQRHSVLFNNTTPPGQVGGVPSFVEIANSAGVADTGWGWGTTFFDANNNTLLDLAAVNGRAGGIWEDDVSLLYRNMGPDAPTRFIDIAPEVGFDFDFVASTVVAADLDRSGRLDLVKSNVQNTQGPGPLQVLMNRSVEGEPDGNWLVVRPRMSDGGNRFAIGTTIHATVGEIGMMRVISAGTSMSGQEPAEAHFGLADHATIDELSIVWPDGTVTVLNDVAANQLLDITTPPVVSCQTLDLTGTGVIDTNEN